MAKFMAAGTATANGVPLPDHCQIQGLVGERTGFAGPTGKAQYGTRFELRLPARAAWKGRFMYQGGGGTQGTLPAATGTAGSASPTLAKGFAVASDNGGHDNTAINPGNESLPSGTAFYSDPQAVKDWAYGAADVTTRTSKAIIDEIYGKGPDHSYFVSCSTSGRQGMAMSQLFPDYYDGIVAGDPFFMPPAISLSEVNGVQAVKAISPVDTQGKPEYYLSYTAADTALFTKAVLQACDKLDGLEDGVIDNNAACTDPTTGFDPATFVFTDTNKPLECASGKAADCLSAPQVDAIKKIARGPRTSTNQSVTLEDGTTLEGYPYDGGWMAATGLPSRNIGTPTTMPGNLTLGAAQIPLFWYTVPEPTFDPTLFNFDTDVGKIVANGNTPVINRSTDLGIFKNRGGKIMFYHGQSDGGPPVTYTINYYKDLEARYGGQAATQAFARLYLVPNMGHCSGGPATDQFDFLTPLMNWVEKGQVPQTVVASGTNFTTEPKTRSRPLCTYPQTVRYTGPQPAGTADIAAASNYTCQ
jgi:feruloyl esterase